MSKKAFLELSMGELMASRHEGDHKLHQRARKLRHKSFIQDENDKETPEQSRSFQKWEKITQKASQYLVTVTAHICSMPIQ